MATGTATANSKQLQENLANSKAQLHQVRYPLDQTVVVLLVPVYRNGCGGSFVLPMNW